MSIIQIIICYLTIGAICATYMQEMYNDYSKDVEHFKYKYSNIRGFHSLSNKLNDYKLSNADFKYLVIFTYTVFFITWPLFLDETINIAMRKK